MKTIKNYTSSIPAATSMSRIEEMLVDAGARDFMKSYNADKQCDAIVFVMSVPGSPHLMHFKLPAKVEACYQALWKIYLTTVKKPTEQMKKTLREQSARTAWKIIHDWVEIQLSLIQLEQADAMEIFLPYAYNPGTKETYYEHLKATQFKQLTYIK